MLISADGSALLLVDVQERLVAALDGGKEMVANAHRLAAAAALLDVPVCATEQAPDKLGPTVAKRRTETEARTASQSPADE